ncbi:MAG: glycerophosphodiester phosphodiesterase family protein [Nitrososphaerales archaeon]
MVLSKVLIIAHRGASAYEPENTLRAIKRAMDLGADMVEIDVRATKDNHIIVMHDETVDRTTNGKGYVKDMTLKELKMLNAGLGESIPTLQEVIQFIKGRAKLVIEIKVLGIEKKVLEIINQNEMIDKVLITSFYHPILKSIKEINPKVQTGAIISSRPIKPAQLALDAKANALLPRYIYVDPEMIDDTHKHGLVIYPWTVDTINEIKKLIKMGVDGIVTNKPDIVQIAQTNLE